MEATSRRWREIYAPSSRCSHGNDGFPHRFWYCVWRCRRESAERYRPQQPPVVNGARKRARSPEPAADEDDEWAADLEEELFS